MLYNAPLENIAFATALIIKYIGKIEDTSL